MGCYKIIDDPPEVLKKALVDINIPGTSKFSVFHRLRKGNLLFTSEDYCKNFQFDNCNILFVQENKQHCYGKIIYFIKVCIFDCGQKKCLCTEGKFYAFIKKYIVSSFNDSSASLKRIKHIKKFTESNDYLLIAVKNLKSILIKILDCYLAEPLNTAQKE